MRVKNQIEIGVFACGVLFFLTGCAKNAIPKTEPFETFSPKLTKTLSETPNPASTPETENTQSAPRVSPYVEVTVTSVEIRYLETNPVQVELTIRGILPDQCKYNFYSVENRANQKIIVRLDGIHPSDGGCLQTEQNVEYILRLGRDMPEPESGFSPGNYNLIVNNYQTSFVIR